MDKSSLLFIAAVFTTGIVACIIYWLFCETNGVFTIIFSVWVLLGIIWLAIVKFKK